MLTSVLKVRRTSYVLLLPSYDCTLIGVCGYVRVSVSYFITLSHVTPMQIVDTDDIDITV